MADEKGQIVAGCQRISVEENCETREWANRPGTTQDRPSTAQQAVGNTTDKMREHLHGH